MILGLIRFALIQRTLILILTCALIVAGVMAIRDIPIDAFPDVSPIQVKIIVKAAGMTPEEIETRITAPIELELLGIPKQEMLRSTAKYSLTDITLDFEEGTDIYWARQQVAERLNAIWNDLPIGVEGGIAPMTTPLGEIFMFTIDSDSVSLMERRNLLDWVIRPALRTVQGVADVNALGGHVRSFEVIPDNQRMSHRGIQLQSLIHTLQANNRNDGAGRVREGEEAILVRAEGQIQSLNDLRSIIIHQPGLDHEVPVSIADVATVRIGSLSRYGAVTRDGKGETVEGVVLGLRDSNARQMVTDIRRKLDEIKSGLPKDVSINIFYDRGTLINQATRTVMIALGQAVLLVVILLVLFLGDLRAALTVALVLPFSALLTFILMRQFNLTANLMSLGGLVIAIGMLVDAAVVIVENISSTFAHPEKNAHLPRLHLIYRACREVAIPVTSGTLIIVIVFLPLLTLQGLEGKLFTPVALTIVFALAGSLLMSLTVIPVLASLLLKQNTRTEPWLPRMLHQLYTPILSMCLKHNGWVLVSSGILLIVTLGLFTQIGKTFMPTLDEGTIVVQLENLPSITLEQSVNLDLRAQQAILSQVTEVDSIIARVGSDEIGLDPMGLNETDAFIMLKSPSAWQASSKEAIIDKIRVVLSQLPGIAFGFTQPIDMRVSEMLTGVRGDVAIKLFGSDLDVLNDKVEEIVAVLKNIEGATDVLASENEGMQYLQMNIKRAAAGRFGLDVDSLENTWRSQATGLQLGIVQEGNQRTPLLLRGNAYTEGFLHSQVVLPSGQSVPVSALAELKRVEGVVSIDRERGQRFSAVQVNVLGRDLVGFVDEAQQKVQAQVNLPTGYYIEWGGEFENQQRAATRLSWVIPIAIGLIFLLLFSTFGSVRQAVLILSNIPLAMIGGVFALWLSGEYLSVPAAIGFIALLGIAVLNGVVMVSYFNQLRSQGMAMAKVIVEGASRRLRPVMMTASSTALGLVPLLFASGPGSEIQKPLAIVVMGGLVTSTLLTLIVFPILYRRFAEPQGAYDA